MPDMSVTDETFQAEMSWLKEEAFQNMLFVLVTEETSHVLRGWLKEEASVNMPDMSVTDETFQAEMF